MFRRLVGMASGRSSAVQRIYRVLVRRMCKTCKAPASNGGEGICRCRRGKLRAVGCLSMAHPRSGLTLTTVLLTGASVRGHSLALARFGG